MTTEKDPHRGDTDASVQDGSGIVEDLDHAAEAAEAEAEEAGVTPGAVMRSAPEGYSTGAGEQVPVTTDARSEAEQEAVLPTDDTAVTPDQPDGVNEMLHERAAEKPTGEA